MGVQYSPQPEYGGGDTMTGPDPANAIQEFNYGLIHFDNFPTAVLGIFQSITLEGWVEIMYMVQDGYNDIFSTFFFVMVVVIGSFFVLNIALAIIWDASAGAGETQGFTFFLQMKARETLQIHDYTGLTVPVR